MATTHHPTLEVIQEESDGMTMQCLVEKKQLAQSYFKRLLQYLDDANLPRDLENRKLQRRLVLENFETYVNGQKDELSTFLKEACNFLTEFYTRSRVEDWSAAATAAGFAANLCWAQVREMKEGSVQATVEAMLVYIKRATLFAPQRRVARRCFKDWCKETAKKLAGSPTGVTALLEQYAQQVCYLHTFISMPNDRHKLDKMKREQTFTNLLGDGCKSDLRIFPEHGHYFGIILIGAVLEQGSIELMTAVRFTSETISGADSCDWLGFLHVMLAYLCSRQRRVEHRGSKPYNTLLNGFSSFLEKHSCDHNGDVIVLPEDGFLLSLDSATIHRHACNLDSLDQCDAESTKGERLRRIHAIAKW